MLFFRTAAVGFVLSALFIMGTANKYLQAIIGTSPVYAFQAAFREVAPGATKLVGAGVIIPTAFILFCLGLGFFVAGAFYPILENGLFTLLDLAGRKVVALTLFIRSGKKAAATSLALLLVLGVAASARAGEFVSVPPEPRDEKALTSSFLVGHMKKAIVVNGLEVAITDKTAYPVQLVTTDNLTVQAIAQVEPTTRRFKIYASEVVADGKGYPFKGYVTDGLRGENTFGLKGNVNFDQSILTLAANIQCVLVVTESVTGLAKK